MGARGGGAGRGGGGALGRAAPPPRPLARLLPGGDPRSHVARGPGRVQGQGAAPTLVKPHWSNRIGHLIPFRRLTCDINCNADSPDPGAASFFAEPLRV